MKLILPAFVILLSVIVSACAPGSANSVPSKLDVGNPPDVSLPPAPVTEQSAPEVATTLPENIVPPSTDVSSLPPAVQTPSTIILADNGKTFTLHAGDSFLLNLGNNVYDWTVTVAPQNVIGLRAGVTVIQGAQGIFDALIPGTAILTATGDPLCRKSTPPCMIPTILFKVTLIVQ